MKTETTSEELSTSPQSANSQSLAVARRQEELEEEAEGEEEWRLQAEQYKNQGNIAFKNGFVEEAIRLFSCAIDLDDQNHVYYSNRSAAYLKLGSAKSKAFQDAKKCVELKPDWAKGYSRKGAAELALGRLQDAQDSYRLGLRYDPGNPALQSGFEKAREAEEIAREKRLAAARQRRETDERIKREEEEAKQRDEALKTDDDRLLDFFAVIDETEQTTHKKPAVAGDANDDEAKDEEAKKTFHEKYKEQNRNLGTARELIDHILAPHYKWRNLNPYFVLNLDVDATDEDIRARYKRVSVKIHPDKNRDIEQEAQEAFEQLKTAYNKLMEKNDAGEYMEREIIVNRIERARQKASREHRLLKSKGLTPLTGLKPLEEMQRVEVMKKFAEAERDREEAIRLRRAHEAREKEQEKVQLLEMRQEREFHKEWSRKERQDSRVGNWREFTTAEEPGKNGAASKLWKVEERQDKKRKFGQVDLEEWKKDWK
mmetsp:Transcript_9609/g.35991  ORF Transcript_9609/g.35991 Transcript_9609/m.35991 type:complete len:485 (-) Transcript_9609:35-1489(-)